jgi:aspartate aminotransferase-like enzyme
MVPRDGLLPDREFDVLSIVHVETEWGLVMPVEPLLAAAKERGAVTIIDAAVSIPIDPLNYDHCDAIVFGSHKCLGGPPGLGVLAVREAILERLAVGAPNWTFEAYGRDALHKHRYLRGDVASPNLPPPLVTFPSQVIDSLGAAVAERLDLGIGSDHHHAAAARLRSGLQEAGLQVARGGRLSAAVVRAEVPPAIGADRLRAALFDAGFFVIGGIGSSGAGAVRIGTMSMPQIATANIDRLIEAVAKVVADIGTTDSFVSQDRAPKRRGNAE